MFHNNEFSIALLETLFFKHFCFLTAVKTLFFHFVFLAYIFIYNSLMHFSDPPPRSPADLPGTRSARVCNIAAPNGAWRSNSP